MRQASNHYFIGLTAIAFLTGSCNAENSSTQKSVSQSVAGVHQQSQDNSPKTQPSEVKPPKIDLVSVGVMANVKEDRAVKIDRIESFDRIVANNQFATPIEGKGGKLIVVYMTLKNTGSESGNMSWSRFRLEDNEGRKYDEIDNFMTQSIWFKEHGLESANAQLFPGGTGETAKIFRVASDAKNLKLVINSKIFKLPSLSESNAQVVSDDESVTPSTDEDKSKDTDSTVSEVSSNKSTISREAALSKVKEYMQAKSQLFAPPFNKNLGANLLTGKLYRDKIDKGDGSCNNPDDCLSSLDWLVKYDGWYSYGVQRINSVDSFESNGHTATITLTSTESRTLHQHGKKKRSGETSQSVFDLVYEDGSIKISDIHNN